MLNVMMLLRLNKIILIEQFINYYIDIKNMLDRIN